MTAVDTITVMRWVWLATLLAIITAVALAAHDVGARPTRIVSALAAVLLLAAAIAGVVVAATSGDELAATQTLGLYAGLTASALTLDWSLAYPSLPGHERWPATVLSAAVCAVMLVASGVHTAADLVEVSGEELGIVLGVAGYASALVLASPVREWISSKRRRAPATLDISPMLFPVLVLLAAMAGLGDDILGHGLGFGQLWDAVQLAVFTGVLAGVFVGRGAGVDVR